MRIRILPVLVLVLLASCTKGDGTGPDQIARIVVTPGQATMTFVGATQQFAAQPMDESGQALAGVLITWRSSNSAVLRVDPSGLATAVGEGAAFVVAESGGTSGQADVLVDVPDCTRTQLVNLAVGGVLVSDPPVNATCAITLPSGAPGDRYRVAVVRLSAAMEASETPVTTLTLVGRGVVAAPPLEPARAPELPPLFGAAETALLEESVRIGRATAAAHARLRAGEEQLLRLVGPLPQPLPRMVAPEGPLPVSPTRRTFYPRSPSDQSCSAKTAVPALLMGQNNDVAVYQDSVQSLSQPLQQTYVTQLMDFFTRYGKVTVESYFGAIPDKDANGQIVVFATPSVSGDIAAFVWGGDQLNRSGASPCPASNEMELVYFSSSLINAIANRNYQALETLVHEVKHIVSFNQRLTGSTFITQPLWLEEGTAEIAGEAATRRAWAAVGGPAQNAMVNRQSFGAQPTLTPENFGISLRLVRTRQYLSTQPNSVVVAPASNAYSVYGSGWHFHRFLGDAFGGAASSPGGDASLFRLQNAGSTPAGLGGLPVITGKTFDALVVDYAAAVMLNGTGAPAPQRAITTYDFPSATTVPQNPPAAPYPYPVTATGSNPSWSFASRSFVGTIGNGGIRIHDFVSNGTGTGTDITVQVEPPARVVVVRLR